MVAQQMPVESESDDYDEHITVEHGGRTVTVPVSGVQRSAYVGRANVPGDLDFDRVYVSDGRIEAETWTGPNTMVSMWENDDGWKCGVIENPEIFPGEPTKLWERPGAAERELEQLVEAGLSATEAVDFWMVHYNERSATDWAESRGCTPQAVSENERNARKKLS